MKISVIEESIAEFLKNELGVEVKSSPLDEEKTLAMLSNGAIIVQYNGSRSMFYNESYGIIQRDISVRILVGKVDLVSFQSIYDLVDGVIEKLSGYTINGATKPLLHESDKPLAQKNQLFIFEIIFKTSVLS